MSSEKNKIRIIWPSFIDKSKKISNGRKIPLKKSISNPTIKEIYDASVILKLEPKLEIEKCYPKSWWENSGRIKIRYNENYKIRNILSEISKIIEKNRTNKL